MSRQYFDSPIGLLEIVASATGLCRLLPTQTRENEAPDGLTERAALSLEEYFAGKREVFDLPLSPKGSPFCQLVWAELARIPYGQVITYSNLAARIGCPKACRAVANAVGKNPLLILLPCHRVVAANGIGGFSAGLPLKHFLLGLEGVKITENPPIF